MPISTVLPKFGRIQKQCRTVRPAVMSGNSMVCVLGTVVPSARFTYLSTGRCRYPCLLARSTVVGPMKEISEPESKRAHMWRSSIRIFRCGRGLKFIRVGPSRRMPAAVCLARCGFSAGGWQSRANTPSFPHREQNFFGGRLHPGGCGLAVCTASSTRPGCRWRLRQYDRCFA